MYDIYKELTEEQEREARAERREMEKDEREVKEAVSIYQELGYQFN